MATTVFDNSRAHEAGRPSISRHPLFAVIVASWFAALLGAGSLVLPAVLLERLVEATGVAALIPAAAPPLGATARGLIALAAAVAGALAGTAIARQVARTHGNEPPAAGSAGARRPISVREDLGEEGLINGSAPVITQRRAIAIAEGDSAPDFPRTPVALAHDSEPATPLSVTEGAEASYDGTAAAAARPKEPAEGADPVPDEPTLAAAEPPLEFSAPSLARRPGAARPLDEPALEELVERLAASIERRRDARAPASPASPGFDPVPPEEAARATAAYFAGGPRLAPVAPPAPEPAAPARQAHDGNGPAAVVSLNPGAAQPAPGPGAPAQTDAALRAALVTLQRMRGAG